MTSQAVGLAEALDLEREHREVRTRPPWRWLPADRSPGVLRLGLAPDSDPLDPPWPDLLITCGRRSAALSIAIRRRSRGRTFTVHIQDPRVSPRHFDLVIPMAHDGLSGPNVIPVTTALHRVTPQRLAAGARRFASLLLPERPEGPVVTVLIGGSSRRHRLDAGATRALAGRLLAMQRTYRARLLVTASRRTGKENCRILSEMLAGVDALFWDGEGENPYLGMLALADFILVTEDSVSMVSEACATGRPVYVLRMPGRASRRLSMFHAELQRRGLTRLFEGRLDPWQATAWNETGRVAEIVMRHLAARHGQA